MPTGVEMRKPKPVTGDHMYLFHLSVHRLTYRTGQDTANCDTCRNSACIIYRWVLFHCQCVINAALNGVFLYDDMVQCEREALRGGVWCSDAFLCRKCPRKCVM